MFWIRWNRISTKIDRLCNAACRPSERPASSGTNKDDLSLSSEIKDCPPPSANNSLTLVKSRSSTVGPLPSQTDSEDDCFFSVDEPKSSSVPVVDSKVSSAEASEKEDCDVIYVNPFFQVFIFIILLYSQCCGSEHFFRIRFGIQLLLAKHRLRFFSKRNYYILQHSDRQYYRNANLLYYRYLFKKFKARIRSQIRIRNLEVRFHNSGYRYTTVQWMRLSNF
jgi:hypothetical protein